MRDVMTMPGTRPLAAHLADLRRNLGDITLLMELHASVSARSGGRLAALQVLNKSAVVLLTACWEAYVEDMATTSFEWLLTNCHRAEGFPNRVRARASQALRNDKNAMAVWALAGDGWRSVLSKHKDETLAETIGTFNTPKAPQVDDLYERLVGLQQLSDDWRWPAMSADRARRKLDRLVSMRGNIAHRVRH